MGKTKADESATEQDDPAVDAEAEVVQDEATAEPPIPDTPAPKVGYWRWEPDGLPLGLYDTPHFGQLIPGRVVEVPQDQTHLVDDHPDFKRSAKQKYDNQPSIADDFARLQTPHTAEEE